MLAFTNAFMLAFTNAFDNFLPVISLYFYLHPIFDLLQVVYIYVYNELCKRMLVGDVYNFAIPIYILSSAITIT